jgi:hypothetical protein
MSIHRFKRSFTFIAALALAACTNPLAPAGDIEIRLAAPAFARTPQGVAEVTYTVTNGGDDTVLLTAPCGDRLNAVVERRVAGRWEQYAGGYCLLSFPTSPVPLAPGAKRVDVSVITEPGVYRLQLGTDRGPAVSQPFAID